jgi:SAM-dependent methyltransferase
LQGVVLDVGGGRDSPLARYWPAGVRRVRLDLSPRFAPAIVADAQRLPLAAGSLNGAVVSEVLEHVRAPEQLLGEVRRVLRDGAPLYGSVPFALGVHADPHDYWRFTAEALGWLLRDFAEVEVRPHGNHVGAAWRALTARWRWLWTINPLVRPFGRRTDARWPVGYTFAARKRR